MFMQANPLNPQKLFCLQCGTKCYLFFSIQLFAIQTPFYHYTFSSPVLCVTSLEFHILEDICLTGVILRALPGTLATLPPKTQAHKLSSACQHCTLLPVYICSYCISTVASGSQNCLMSIYKKGFSTKSHMWRVCLRTIS